MSDRFEAMARRLTNMPDQQLTRDVAYELRQAFADGRDAGIEACIADTEEDYCEFADQAAKRFRRLKTKGAK
jgi:hypothetical protein